MGLRIISLLLSFYLVAGTLDFIFQYPYAAYSPLLIYPESGTEGFYLNGKWVPLPLYHISPQFFPSPYRRDVEGNYWNLTGKRKEILLGSRGDLSLRWMGEEKGVVFQTLSRRSGRQVRVTAYRQGSSLLYLDAGRRKGDFTGRWEDWFTLSLSKESGGVFVQGFRAEGTGGFSGAKLGLWGKREGEISGKWGWEASAKTEFFYGLEEGKTEEFFLGEKPFLKTQWEDSHFLPWGLKISAGIKRGGLSLGLSGGLINGRPWLHPYGRFLLRTENMALFLSLAGITPPVEYLRGMGRKGGVLHLYSWDGEWKDAGSIEPPSWEGAPGPFTRFQAGVNFGRPSGFYAGGYFIKDWRIPETMGLCRSQEKMDVFVGEDRYELWNCQGFEGYRYGNFSSLWRQQAVIYAGAGLGWEKIRINLTASYFYLQGTYPFPPFSVVAGDFFPYSSSFMDDGNWEPEKNSSLKGELPGIAGFSGLLKIKGEILGVRMEGFALGFRNFTGVKLLMVHGLSQGGEYILVGRIAGDWNLLGGIRLTKEFSWGGVILAGEGFSLREDLWDGETNGERKTLLYLPRWRVFLGLSLR